MTTDQIIARIEAKGAEQAKLLAADHAKEVTVEVMFADRRGDFIRATVTGIAPFTAEKTVGGLSGAPGMTVLGQPYTGRYGQRTTLYRDVKCNGESLLKLPLLNEAEAATLAAALNLRVKIAADDAAIGAMIAEQNSRAAGFRELADALDAPALVAAE